jgi:outer membrane protein TolC
MRKEQAALGDGAAAAAVDLAEREAIYAVTRTYFTILFARDQLQVTNKVVQTLDDARENAERLLGKPGAPKELNQNMVDKNKVFLQLAESHRIDAEQGIQRAMAALREAMGVSAEFPMAVPTDALPEPRLKISKEDILASAISRRAEMNQAVIGAEVTALEKDIQRKSCGFKRLTFAAAVDLHAHPIPEGMADGEYRPGALGLEMPVYMIGSKSARVEHMEALTARADAVVDKTRNLITLEAEDAYLRWEGSARKLTKSREAADKADKVSDDTLNDFKANTNVSYRDVLESAVIAAQARAQYNEIRFNHVLALAALERIAAGGFSAGFHAAVLCEQ